MDIIENLEGAYSESRYGKMKVTVSYESASEEDPFGKKLLLLPQCFQWMEFKDIQRKQAVKRPEAPKKKGLLSRLFGK